MFEAVHTSAMWRIVTSWTAVFFMLQILTVTACWVLIEIPMYCVYGVYALTVLWINLFRWPSDQWLCIAIPQTVHDGLCGQRFDGSRFTIFRDLHDSKKADALFTTHGRTTDTRDLAHHIHEAFFVKAVVYNLLVFAIAVSTAVATEGTEHHQLTSSDWFKAVLLFVVLIMGLLWDAAICFYQRTLNERCHRYLVLTVESREQSIGHGTADNAVSNG